MPTTYYRALLEPAADGGFGVIFPDFTGCVSGGDDADHAVRMAAEALALHVGGMIEDGDPLPEPGRFDAPLPDWLDEPGEVPAAGFIRVLVPVELPGKAQRLNISLEESLVARIDSAATARGMSRSAFLAEGARRLLAGG